METSDTSDDVYKASGPDTETRYRSQTDLRERSVYPPGPESKPDFETLSSLPERDSVPKPGFSLDFCRPDSVLTLNSFPIYFTV